MSPAVNVDNVDTHNVASHKTSDESHVNAFKLMVERVIALLLVQTMKLLVRQQIHLDQ